MFIQSEIGDKKVFTSGTGKLFQYTFVPAIASKLYQKYYALSTQTYDMYKEIKKIPDFKKLTKNPEGIQKRLDKSEEFRKLAEESNQIGLKIIKMVLTRNPQADQLPDSDEELEDYIMTEMSIEDMNRFILAVCSPDVDEKKN
jgi:hypothetical protein